MRGRGHELTSPPHRTRSFSVPKSVSVLAALRPERVRLYPALRTAQFLFEAQLRHELG